VVRTLGVIPARGGSKRIPRKNLRLLCGKPLIWYTIEAAKQAKRLTDWVVSTEDKEIADLALSYGAFVVKRPDSLAEDDTTSGAVVRHALDWMEVDREPYDMVVLLHPTSPIRDPKHIDEAVEKLWACPFHATLASVQMLPRKAHENVKSLKSGVAYLDGDDVDTYDVLVPSGLSLDRASPCIYNGSIYAMKRDWFLEHNEHTRSVALPLVMDRFHSLDVDEEADLAIAGVYLGGCNGL
jgi:CMP-N,N'-diacetyllegionaminic acid synthase